MRIKTMILLFTCLALTGFSQNLTISFDCVNPSSHDFISFLKGWQTLIAAIIVIIGWFVNSRLNRKAEIAKRRSEHRLTALKSFVDSIYLDMSKDIDQAFKKPDFKDKLENVRATIQM